jgi:tRNA 2-selenouridine synthase
LPPAVWQAMEQAPRIVLLAPIDVRADYLVRSYPDVIADRGLLEHVLSRLEVYPGRKQLTTWRELADVGAYAELVTHVVERHYDPSYTRLSGRDQRPKVATLELGALDDAAQDAAARRIAGLLAEG